MGESRRATAPAFHVGAVVAAMTVVVGACGGSTGSTRPSASASVSVGPAGATITAEGVSLAIPAGALSSSTTISVAEDPARPPAPYMAFSPLFRFAPDGLVFAKPVTVSFATLGASPAATVYWSNATGYEAVPTRWMATTASASVTHFSEGFVGIAPGDGGSAGDAGTDAGPGLGQVCNISGPGPLCAPSLTCFGGRCIVSVSQPGGFCDDTNSVCNTSSPGCGGPYQLACHSDTNTCECTCNCSGPCSECPYPSVGAGGTCYATPTIQPGSGGNLYPTCINSLSCLNGTCEPATPDSGSPQDAAGAQDSAVEAMTTDAGATGAPVDAGPDAGPGLGQVCNISGPGPLCAPSLTCFGGRCIVSVSQPGGFCDNTNSVCNTSSPGCGGPYQLACHTGTNTCECTCNCSGPCSECPYPSVGAGGTCYATATVEPGSGGNLYPTCINSLSCVNGTCQ